MLKKISICIFLMMMIAVSPCYAVKSLKKTVAVFDFKNDSGFRSKGNLGQDFSTQLNDALIQSGEFIVLSRKDLDVVMAEQDLAQSDRFAKSTSARTGKIVASQILIKGQITEFEENTSGGGQGLSIKGFKIGAKKSTAHIAVIIQLIDSTTGEILHSKRVEGEAKSGGLSLGYSGDFDISSSNFQKTPLGKAVQMAIDRAVNFVSKKAAEVDWRGKVVLVKGDEVFINAGQNVGVQNGDTFSVWREGEALIDPDTGIELGRDSSKVADVSVFSVEDKFSKARVVGAAQGEIQKGNVVKE
ncbi:MAG: hypothetical protein K8S27_03745 [Candidatus Omnitrophica bacterium]|nr:hypothetical protein [Candidatus Omnitrophota bacterium]